MRDVPTVTIDFGNDNVIKRTLHGNVATYVCDGAGNVLDVLPGIYEPETFTRRLWDFRMLHSYVKQRRLLGENPLADYHAKHIEAIESEKIFAFRGGGRSITGAESSIGIMLQPAKRIQTRARIARGVEIPEITKVSAPDSTKELAGWEALAEDTLINETQRRLQIHKHLQEKDSITPEQMKKWLYREVLHADLDDPYLGLGKILFDSYPFAAEDAQ